MSGELNSFERPSVQPEQSEVVMGPQFLHDAFKVKKEQFAREIESRRAMSLDEVDGMVLVDCSDCRASSDIRHLGSNLKELHITEVWLQDDDGTYDIADIQVTADIECPRSGCPTTCDPSHKTRLVKIDVAPALKPSGHFEKPDGPITRTREIYKDGEVSFEEEVVVQPGQFEPFWVNHGSTFASTIEAVVALNNIARRAGSKVATTRQLIDLSAVEVHVGGVDGALEEQLDAQRLARRFADFTGMDILYINVDLFGTTSPTDIGLPTFTSAEMDQPHDQNMIDAHAAANDRFIDAERILRPAELLGELDELRIQMGFPLLMGSSLLNATRSSSYTL